MRKIQVHQVDAFTRERFTGNPAGVVLNADGLTEAQMLAIARELNNADTAFILSPESNDHQLRARFFTPRTEAGFVGHATVAAHYVLSRRHDAPRHLRQKSKAGTVDIEVRGVDDDRSIAVRQTTPPLGRELNDRERLAVLDALALALATAHWRLLFTWQSLQRSMLHPPSSSENRASTSALTPGFQPVRETTA